MKRLGSLLLMVLSFAGAYLTRKQSLWYDEGGEAGKDLSREPMMLRVASRLLRRP